MLLGVGFGPTGLGGSRVRGPWRRATSCWLRRCGMGLHARWQWEAYVRAFRGIRLRLNTCRRITSGCWGRQGLRRLAQRHRRRGQRQQLGRWQRRRQRRQWHQCWGRQWQHQRRPAVTALAVLVQCEVCGWRDQDIRACTWCTRAICGWHGLRILGREPGGMPAWQCREDDRAECWRLWVYSS